MKLFVILMILLSLVGCKKSEKGPVRQETNARFAIFDRIGDINDYSRPRPLVSLELFFEGNNDAGSIGYNLPDPPKPGDFYALFKSLRAREDVHDILIEVKDLEDPKGWPSTDTIWFITTVKATDVRSWFPERFSPDDMIVGFEQSLTHLEFYELPKGHHAIGAWYD